MARKYRVKRSLFKRAAMLDKLLKTRVKRKRKGPKVTRLLKDKTVASLRYVDVVTLNAAAAGITSASYRANGPYDPQDAVGGHQPLMWDEYTPLYSQYRVISSKIKITPVSTVASNGVPALYGVYLDKNTTLSYPSGLAIIEDKRVKGTWAINSGFTLPVDRYGHGTKQCTFNAKRFLSPEGAADSYDTATVPSSTDNRAAFFNIWTSSIDGGDPASVSFILQIDYLIEFTGPKHVTQS